MPAISTVNPILCNDRKEIILNDYPFLPYIYQSRSSDMNAKNDFKVADMSLAEWGRKEIAIAETEM
ncbi:MAG: adenosylhomocysteinase, partial [Pseudomonadota bacterium]|nr:adenosylhomocysteinase [Pseudomonadota bacterium]